MHKRPSFGASPGDDGVDRGFTGIADGSVELGNVGDPQIKGV